MLEESESRAEAERIIDTLLGLLEVARSLQLTSRHEGKELRAALELTVRAAPLPEKP